MLTVAEQDLHLLCSESQFETSRFSAVQRLSTEIQTTRYTTHVDTSQVGSVNMPRALVDETARSILSENKTCSAFQPIITTGDGNCLFNAASRSICGNERMASELRLRTSLELINNQEFYSSHPVTELKIMTQSGKLWPKESVYDVVIFSNITKNIAKTCGFEEAMKKETLVTLRKCAFSGILQIMGLASALNCTIKMIYPDKRHTLFELLNGTFKPRICEGCNPVLTIMWTNLGGWLDRTKGFYPNHFVPLLPLTGNCNTWTTVVNKKKLKRAPPSHTIDDSASVTHSGTKKRGLRQFGDFFPPTLRTSTLLHDKAPSNVNNPEQLSKQSDIKQSDTKKSDLKQDSKRPFISFSSPIIVNTETINKSAEKEPKGGLFSDFLPNKRCKPFHAKAPPKTNQPVRGSCNQSSLKQSTLYWSLSNNANSDVKNPNSKCGKSDTATFLPHDKAPSTVNNPEQLLEQSAIKQSDTKKTDLKQASKHSFVSFSSPIIANTETINRSAEKEPKAGLFSDFLQNKRRKPFYAKTPPKTNQPIRGSCNQSSLKQSTLYWSLSNNANSDVKNPNSKCEKSDVATSLGTKAIKKKPLTPFPTRKRLFSSVDDCDNLPPKKHHTYLVNDPKHSTPNPKHSSPRNCGQSTTKHLPSSEETKTCDITTTKPTNQTLDQASNYFTSVSKEVGLISKQPILSSTDLPLSGMRREFYNKRGKLFYKNSKRKHSSISPQVDGSNTQFRRSTIKGNLKDNIMVLENKLKSCKLYKFCSLNGTHLVAKYLIKHGPIVPTRELVTVYRENSSSLSQRRIMSSELFQILAKHLNIMQFTINGKAFISENTSSDFTSLVSFINAQKHDKQNLNSKIEESIGDHFRDAIKYMDSKRDRDTAIALLEKVTSVNFVSKSLLGVENKSRVKNCRDNLIPNLNKFNNIRVTSQVVRNDMTNKQQAALTERIINKRKIKEILHIKPGRGRKLKCEENPNLAPLLEYAFMENGIQSHPRLTVDTLYRTPDSNVVMRDARELVLAMSDPSFSISLSSCYNYTQNYKKNTLQAKRHHDGKGVNASISLHQPPRIGVAKFALNLHWSSSNVNFLVDQAAEQPEDYFIDSKDAKSVVHGDITPVQKPMKTWKQREGVLPDHDWEQGRANAVTPMAHLSMETLYPEKLNLPLTAPSSGISVTRSGKGINLIYLSHYEPETVFRQLNEILFLMVQPCFDKYFRNAKTGQLKQNFAFIVDNGPSEQPSSTMVVVIYYLSTAIFSSTGSDVTNRK